VNNFHSEVFQIKSNKRKLEQVDEPESPPSKKPHLLPQSTIPDSTFLPQSTVKDILNSVPLSEDSDTY